MSYTADEQFGDVNVTVHYDHPEEGVSIRFDTPPPPDCVSYKDLNVAEYKKLLDHLLMPVQENGRDGERYRRLSQLAGELRSLLAQATPPGEF